MLACVAVISARLGDGFVPKQVLNTELALCAAASGGAAKHAKRANIVKNFKLANILDFFIFYLSPFFFLKHENATGALAAPSAHRT
jgi:hypothetical protein